MRCPTGKAKFEALRVKSANNKNRKRSDQNRKRSETSFFKYSLRSNTHAFKLAKAFGESRGYFRHIPRFPCERLKLAKNRAQVNNKVPNLFLLLEYFLIE